MAVSVDPEGDSPALAREFRDKWELTDSLDFLVGDRRELAAVWDAYHLAPSVSQRNTDHSEGETAGAEAARESVDALRQESARYLVVHSAPIYVIDREGLRAVRLYPPVRHRRPSARRKASTGVALCAQRREVPRQTQEGRGHPAQ